MSSTKWHHCQVTFDTISKVGFGIAVSNGREDCDFVCAESAVVVSDVLPAGPAWGLVQVNDIILSANGISLENADYAKAIRILKESQQLNMIVKRRVPIPLIEYEQRTLKFTLSKSRKKEDFGIVLGCKFFIKEITNRKLAEKDPGLREGDTVLRINGQSVEGVTIEQASKWLLQSREKLSLVVQRDVRRDASRWPSQNTVYERLGSVSGTPRHSPSPMRNLHQNLVPRSSLDANTSTTTNTRWSQSDQPSLEYGDFCKRNGSIASNQGQSDIGVRTIRFRKIGGSLGVRVIGGNQVGIFVSAVQEDSPAALHSIRQGDRILYVNDKSMIGVTREEAVRHLLALQDDVTIKVEYAPNEFERIRNSPLGDNFYIRTHFAHQKSSNHLELSFHNGDIFHITDTLFGGTVGFWQATRVYSAADSANYGQNDNCKGVIPNLETAEMLAKAARADTSTCGRSTFFRRKLKERRTKSLTKNVIDDVTFENTCDMAFPAYERVTLKHPQFQRPLVLFGPLADIARQRLLTNFALRFSGIADESIMRLSAIDAVINANKHCVLDVSPGSVERLQLAQYAPIVIFIDVESRSRIRDLRSKAATLDATKEDGWFEALLQLIAHLQDRRVWMPEFRPLTNLNDVILLPMHCFHNPSDSDVDSIKGEYSTSEYLTRSQVQLEKGDPHVKVGYDEFDPKYQRSLRLTPSHLNPNNYPPPPSPAAPGMLASRGTFYQNVYPCEPLSQYSSRVQLTSPCINPTAQQLPSSVQRNYYFDTPTSSTSSIPTWATLPRRQNNHIVDTFPTTTITEPGILTRTITNTPIIKTTATITTSTTTTTTTTTTTITNRLLNYSQSILTRCNPSQFVIQQQQQHSPVAQRQQHFRQRNILQSSSLRQSPQKSSDKASPPQVSADTYHSGGSSKTAHEDDIISSTMAISNNCNTMTTNIITDMNKNRRINLAIPEAADTVTDNNMPSAFHDMKQIELEKSTVNARKNQQSHYQNADNSSSYAVNNHLNSVKNHMNHTGQPGLFYDHLTRDRWMCNQSDRRLNTPHQATYENSSPRVPASEELSFCAKNFNMNRNEVEMIYGTSTDNCSTQSTHASVATTEVDSLSECINTENMKLDEVNNGRKNYSDTTIIEHITDIIGARGGTLNCPKTGVSLIIPEGAINEGSMQEIYIKVCRANEAESQPPLDESRGESLMSPLVMCGPQDLQFNVPVELRLPHSVSNNADNWSLALKSCDGQHWDQMALDRNTSSAVTDNYVSIKINHF